MCPEVSKGSGHQDQLGPPVTGGSVDVPGEPRRQQAAAATQRSLQLWQVSGQVVVRKQNISIFVMSKTACRKDFTQQNR